MDSNPMDSNMEEQGTPAASRTGGQTPRPANKSADKSETKAARPQPAGVTETSTAKAGPAADAVSIIKQDHRRVEALFAQFDKAKSASEKKKLVDEVTQLFLTHGRMEEEIFYPACKGKVDDALLDEAQVEHDSAKILVGEIRNGSPDDEYYDAKVKVLSEYIKHHVGEEEKPGTGILDAAKKAGVDMAELGREMTTRRDEIARRVERETSPPMPSLMMETPPSGKETRMAQQDYMERSRSSRYEDDDDRRGRRMPPRDEEGRFTSEGRGGGYRSSRYEDDDDDRRGRRMPPRDEEGRFTSEGRSGGYRSSRYEDDDDRRGGRGHGGWFGDPEGHSAAARRGWENTDHGRSGWFGDPEGHSEASRRGWDERYSGNGRSRYDDEDRYGRGRSMSARERGDDDDDRRRGRSGWYGDPRGHSEAARRGWENR